MKYTGWCQNDLNAQGYRGLQLRAALPRAGGGADGDRLHRGEARPAAQVAAGVAARAA